jgi:predicted regulator of Ras-like GTPase activity (Roadblock/LC7/MglB family)
VTDKAGTVDLTWLVDDLVRRVAPVEHAIVLSNDGLLMAASDSLARADAEHLAAVASGLNSLARGAGPHVRHSPVRRTIVEYGDGYLFVTAAGNSACLAVVCAAGTDVRAATREMDTLIVRVGHYLSTAVRGQG